MLYCPDPLLLLLKGSGWQGKHFGLLEVTEHPAQLSRIQMMSAPLFPSWGDEAAAPSQLNLEQVTNVPHPIETRQDNRL